MSREKAIQIIRKYYNTATQRAVNQGYIPVEILNEEAESVLDDILSSVDLEDSPGCEQLTPEEIRTQEQLRIIKKIAEFIAGED